MPDLAVWQWLLGGFCAVLIGLAKTGAPGAATLTVPLMVMTVGDARHAAAWTAPILITGDIFAVAYWRRHAESRTLFSLIPWVAAGMVVGGLALSLNEPVLRRILGVIVLTMLAVNLLRRRNPGMKVGGHPSSYGIAAGFATTVANAAGPVMSMYLMTKQLPKEQFVATGSLVLSCRQYRQAAHLRRPSPLHASLAAVRRDDGSTGHLRRLYRLVGHAPHSTTLLRRLDPGDDGDFHDHSVSLSGQRPQHGFNAEAAELAETYMTLRSFAGSALNPFCALRSVVEG